MATEKRSGVELLEEPDVGFTGGPMDSETPFNQTVDMLSKTEGKELELMCRTNRQIAEAATIGYNMAFCFHSKYVTGKIDQIMRLSVSNGGQGRAEMVQSLQAGSGVPDSYYEAQSGINKGFIEE